jgi:hypothetical protein
MIRSMHHFFAALGQGLSDGACIYVSYLILIILDIGDGKGVEEFQSQLDSVFYSPPHIPVGLPGLRKVRVDSGDSGWIPGILGGFLVDSSGM